MNQGILQYCTILTDLKNFESIETPIETLLFLNELVKTTPEGIVYFYIIGGFSLVINLMKNNNNLTGICLKILANASKKEANFRTLLARSNIFDLLSSKLEENLLKNMTVLYSALIVILVQGNNEAQNQMRISGCLSNIVKILNCTLDEMEEKPVVPYRQTELIAYAIMACIKNPRNHENQTEVGWIIPKILNYFDKKIVFLDNEQLQLEKAFWSFLKSALDINELNQQIFVDNLGLAVVFRSMQEILEEEKTEEMGVFLSKMTGILVKLKCHKILLWQASNYCGIIILLNLLKTNNSLVIQHILTFLESLILEIPQALNIIKDQEILKGMEKSKTILLNKQIMSSPCKDIWCRARCPSDSDISFQDDLTCSHFNFTPVFEDDNLQHSFCILHGYNFQEGIHSFSSGKSDISPIAVEKARSLHKLRQPNLYINKREFRERDKKLRKTVRQDLCSTVEGKRCNVIILLMKSISWGLQKLWRIVSRGSGNGILMNNQCKIIQQGYKM